MIFKKIMIASMMITCNNCIAAVMKPAVQPTVEGAERKVRDLQSKQLHSSDPQDRQRNRAAQMARSMSASLTSSSLGGHQRARLMRRNSI